MRLPLYQLDAFADRPFTGNPAAVVPLARWLPDATLQAIALENNLAETAFLVRRDGGADGGAAGGADGAVEYDLRWFTPAIEVDLCGHATLASAAAVQRWLAPGAATVRFHTRSGALTVTGDGRDGGLLTMDFPALPPKPLDAAAATAVAEALGQQPEAVLAADKALAVLADEASVLAARPDLRRLAALPHDGLIVSAPGRNHDFVSRFFAPHAGIDEDPVTGSAHCVLAPYWAGRLGKTALSARQVSARGGELALELKGARVAISGRVAPYLEGVIELPVTAA
ncbi:phenazine biosynthesis protein PhzF family [Tistlia consotensis]|uniref:Phenazine biosynthesis protein PhzF family n=1 Tax=Tistlia consotensis USBA 355 TaxID=560819 RepID=A0A1Y6BWD5_9PROT|nr:PhzF family phenazine biosynthesis protein [Tistlia consotensis]SMF32520.1 phenazine biosynthesis protein PhzF family [Tistlia consotensis USBA 355]SNR68588.1 phenazine biosynthesis protein PhzF family [Tistlia consotensis]